MDGAGKDAAIKHVMAASESGEEQERQMEDARETPEGEVAVG